MHITCNPIYYLQLVYIMYAKYISLAVVFYGEVLSFLFFPFPFRLWLDQGLGERKGKGSQSNGPKQLNRLPFLIHFFFLHQILDPNTSLIFGLLRKPIGGMISLPCPMGFGIRGELPSLPSKCSTIRL